MNDDAFDNLIRRLADRGGSGAPEPAEDARLSQNVSDESVALRKALVVRAGARSVGFRFHTTRRTHDTTCAVSMWTGIMRWAPTLG